jgi:hypothetical protein
MRLTYAGIGSRKTPRAFQSRMHSIARVLETRGWMLHSGGADRADTWFESGVRSYMNARIFLPWPGFNEHESPLYTVCERAHEIARQFHPVYHRLDAKGRLLMGRNSYQVLGPDLASPVTCIVCWTADGSTTGAERSSGGTGQALRIAAAYDVPVFNLHDTNALDRLDAFVREVEAARRVPFDPLDVFACERADGRVICKICGLSYAKHPEASNGVVHRICDGAWTRDGQPDVVWVKT